MNENLLNQIFRIRKIEETIAEIYPSDKIQSPVHLSNGQEAVAVGVCNHLEITDLVFGSYRGHALYLAKGGDLKKMMAELFGKRTGSGKGKAGSMHLADADVGVMGCSAIVASTISHAVGAAYGAKLRKSGQVVVCFFGDGATGEGVYHESLNFAAKHCIPILFVCENNGWAISTRVKDVHSFEIASHARTYGFSATRLEEGWDVDKIFYVAGQEIEALRAGQGPRYVEIQTSRYMQHVGPEPGIDASPQSKESPVDWRIRDPLTNIQLEASVLADVEKELKEAIDFAEHSAFPDIQDLLEDVY